MLTKKEEEENMVRQDQDKAIIFFSQWSDSYATDTANPPPEKPS
jgi:hypothetical protein